MTALSENDSAPFPSALKDETAEIPVPIWLAQAAVVAIGAWVPITPFVWIEGVPLPPLQGPVRHENEEHRHARNWHWEGLAKAPISAVGVAMSTRVVGKPQYKKVLPDPQCSWRYLCCQFDRIPFQLHYHAAYELALVLGSRGYRYVGDSVERYDELDLVLTGPGLAHTWCSDPALDGQLQQVLALQMPASWLERLAETLPEMQPMRSLLLAARRGFQFSARTCATIQQLFAELQHEDPFDQFVTLVQMLKCLKADADARLLASVLPAGVVSKDAGMERIEKVMEYIHRHYTDDLRAEQLAKYAHMSTNHFHRFIKQRTDKTFNELVTELRIGKACSLLLNSSQQIASICSQCGFNDLSNFNRRFMQLKHCTPTEYRRVCLRQPIDGGRKAALPEAAAN